MTSHRYIASKFALGSLVSTFASALASGLVISVPSTLAAEIRESQSNEIGYATVAEALVALRNRIRCRRGQTALATLRCAAMYST
jgi:hypothetical protein